MTTTISIPTTLREVTSRLNGLGRFLTAGQWERAAMVWAFTRDGAAEFHGNQHALRSSSTTQLTPREFAALGLIGLKSDTTVRRYRAAWQGAMDEGHAIAVAPGDKVELPDLDWPPTGNSHGIADAVSPSAPVRRRAEAVRELLKDHDVAEEVMRHHTTRHHLMSTREGKAHTATAAPAQSPAPRIAAPPIVREHDFDRDVERAVTLINQALYAREDGRWSPEPISVMLLHFLVQRMNTAGPALPVEMRGGDLINEVEDYLRTEVIP